MKDAKIWWRDLFCLPLTLLYSPLVLQIDLQQVNLLQSEALKNLLLICEYFRPQGRIKH